MTACPAHGWCRGLLPASDPQLGSHRVLCQVLHAWSDGRQWCCADRACCCTACDGRSKLAPFSIWIMEGHSAGQQPVHAMEWGLSHGCLPPQHSSVQRWHDYHCMLG